MFLVSVTWALDDISMLAWNSSFTKKRRGWTPAPKRHGNTTKMTGKLLTTWKSSDQKKKPSKINVPGDADKPLKHCSHSSLWILD